MPKLLSGFTAYALLAVILLSLVLNQRADADPLSTSPYASAFDRPLPIDELSHRPWRSTFAKPILDGGNTLYFDSLATQMWRLNWKEDIATPVTVSALSREGGHRYTVVRSKAGLWFIGPIVLLVLPDEKHVAIPFDSNEPSAVALQDGSVFVLGRGVRNHTEQMRRLVPTPQGIVVEDKGLLPHSLSGRKVDYMARYGVAAITLNDGRVLTAGGGYADAKRAAIVDPISGKVEAIADMPHKRTYAVLVLLADGRVVVAGHEHLNCKDHDVRTVDLYDPRFNVWQSLPDLPFPLCADAYGASGPSGTGLADGTVVLGGHLERHILALRPSTASANGYANFWEVLGPTKRERISGVLQAISKSQIAIAGGVHREEGCCSGTPGAEIIPLPAQAFIKPDFQSFGLRLLGPGIARRGPQVFITAGRIFSTTSTGQMRYSSLAELLDLSTGLVQQLPSLPFAAGSAQVVWLDEDRILVKGQPPRGPNLSVYMPLNSVALAIYNIKAKSWKMLGEPKEIKDAVLLDARGDEALLMTNSATLWRLNLTTLQVEHLPPSRRPQMGAIARWLPDGRVVVAGGNMQEKSISIIDDSCEILGEEPGEACPEKFAPWGPFVPAQRYQTFLPSDKSTAGTWEISKNQQASIALQPDQPINQTSQTLIEAQGRVTRLIVPTESSVIEAEPLNLAKLRVERSSPAGWIWQALPKRDDGISPCRRDCRLILAQDPRDAHTELLFLQEGALEDDWFNQDFDRDPYPDLSPAPYPAGRGLAPQPVLRLWWLDGASGQWHQVLQAEANALRSQVFTLKVPLSSPGYQIQSMGWHLTHPILWVAPN